MERFKEANLYILDMEWAEDGDIIQPLEIALLPADVKSLSFFSFIQPTDFSAITPDLLHFLRLKSSTLEKAPAFRDVIYEMSHKMLDNSGKSNIAIIWHSSTKENFLRACKENRIRTSFQEIISLRDIMLISQEINAGSYGLRKMLKSYDICFDARFLNTSSYDVLCLKKLFLQFRKSCEESKLKECLKACENTKVIHAEGCPYCKTAKTKSIREFSSSDLFLGYRFCKHCSSSIQPWVPVLSTREGENAKLQKKAYSISPDKQLDEEFIATMCVHFDLEYAIKGYYIEIRTSCGRWKLYHDGKNIIKVFHGNHYGKVSKQGYHEQNLKSESLYEVLRYIYEHDRKVEEKKIKSNKRAKDQFVRHTKKVAHHSKRNYYVEKDE